MSAERLKIEGNALLKDGKLEEACATYSRAVEESSQNLAAVLCNRALVYLRLHKGHAALEDANAALSACPSCPPRPLPARCRSARLAPRCRTRLAKSGSRCPRRHSRSRRGGRTRSTLCCSCTR